ncbi:SLC13 family permease [Falsiroseomonas bella]|uniref:SLC13 family permease n=1 Tax=Falsiroseomonas bella TaxID=2184016 RepID=A0A317FD16_9PROT|nr:SLC13 family permease [Falsiroseomonas bella]PWS35438.1 SLC13 family permease [Falsiroseomonas bella]
MTLDQSMAFAILGVTIGLFVWGRLPYDLVALLALLAGLVSGVVTPEAAFAGFSDDIVIIVASALLVSAAVARSGVVETVMRPLLSHLRSPATQVPVLAGVVLLLSGFVKNIGAVALLMPVAFQLARRTGHSPSALLMPMAFASLLGGVVTLIGTSPNIVVSRMREEILGEPFRMFDFAPVGAVVAVAGLAFLAVGWRLLPRGRRGSAGMEAAFTIETYTTEATLPEESPMAGRTLGELEAMAHGVRAAVVIRERFRRLPPSPELVLRAGDVLLLDGEPEELESLQARAGLVLAGERQAEKRPVDEPVVVEGVVTEGSALVGRTPAELELGRRQGVALIAVSRSGQRVTRRLAALRFRAGDVVILKGAQERLPEALGELRVLPLSGRDIALGSSRRSIVPAAVLAAAMLLVGLNLVPVAVAFFGAAVVLLVLRALTMREAYEAVEWPVLILLGALIPVSEAIRTTGGSDLLAGWLAAAVQHLPPMGALAAIMAFAMAVTPFLNNAATVLVLAPIAASLAQRLNLAPDPFLMAVALGAACDFLTPIGHQCNTLVMGPGGYRFADYPRLGLPLTLIVLAVGVPMIAFVWPLAPR